MALRREDKIRFEVVAWREDTANWNKRVPDAPVMLGKNVAVFSLDGLQTSWCLTDKDILEIIRAHAVADMENIRLIKAGASGLVKYPEISFIEKVLILFDNLRQAEILPDCDKK